MADHGMADNGVTENAGEAGSGKLVLQAGAICFRRGKKGSLRVLLVGSRRNGRWGLPKGHIDPCETSHAAASREAFEEAGIRGKVREALFGTFEYTKDSSPNRYRVLVHLLQTTSVAGHYPEKSVRKKQWFPLDIAMKEASQPGLCDMLSHLVETSKDMK